MYHRTEVRASGLPEMTSQKRVTFFLASSLIGEEGLMRKDTVGLSGKKLIIIKYETTNSVLNPVCIPQSRSRIISLSLVKFLNLDINSWFSLRSRVGLRLVFPNE